MATNVVQQGIFCRVTSEVKRAGVRKLIESPPFLIRSYIIKNGKKVMATVCLLIGDNETMLARGISICSPYDNYSKKTGRNKAFGRAVKAMVRAVKGTVLAGREPIQYPPHPHTSRPHNFILRSMGFTCKSDTWPLVVRVEERTIVTKAQEVFNRFRSQLEEKED